MLIGIIANITKENVFQVVSSFISKLKQNNLDYILTKSLSEDKDKLKIELFDDFITDDKEVYEKADLIISIGGDGTMLATAFNAQFYDKPVLGVNLGKLGFLVEANIDQMDKIIKELKEGKYSVEERMVISGEALGHETDKLYAVFYFLIL